MTFFIRDAEVWRTGSAMFVRDGETWRTCSVAYVRNAETWSLFHSAAVEPSLASVGASVSQQGTELGGFCVDPYIFEVSWTVNDSAAGYTISIDAGFNSSNPPSEGGVATGLALASSPYNDTWTGLFYDAGGTQYYYRALVKIIRTSDSAVVSQMYTSVISSELVSACIV